MKKTKWFPADIKPVRAGWYETKSQLENQISKFRWFFDGNEWVWFYYESTLQGKNRCNCQNRVWRGLAKKP